MSSSSSPSSPQVQLHGTAAVGAARELATAPLPPRTSVLVVVRSGAGARVAALPQVWNLPRVCEANLLSLLPRLVVRGVSTDIDPYYWKYQCGQGLMAAVKHDNLKMIKWLHLYCPCVLPYNAMVEATKIDNLGLLQWFAARYEQIVWIPQTMDAAASTGQTEVLQWLYDRPNNHGCTTRIAFASVVRGDNLDTVKWFHDHYGHLVAKSLQAVHEAIRNGHAEVVKFVFRRPLPVQCEFLIGINVAAFVGDLELFQWLYSKPTAASHMSYNPIDSAARGGHLHVV